MSKKMTRKELNNKYVEYPRIHFDYDYSPTKDELINFYEDRIKAVCSLMNDLDNVKTNAKENCNFSMRQTGCIFRIQNDDKGWDKETQIFEQKYYEMLDFIFYNEESVEDKVALCNSEIAIVKLMGRLLFEIASKRIIELKN